MNLHYAKMRFARALCLSVIYTLLILVISNQIDGWIVSHSSAEAMNNDNMKSLHQFRLLFIVGNSAAFTASLLWLARLRALSPLGRYLIPAVLAAGVTFIVAFPVLVIENVPSPGA